MGISWLKIKNSDILFFLNYNLLNSATILSIDKEAVGLAGVTNSKMYGS